MKSLVAIVLATLLLLSAVGAGAVAAVPTATSAGDASPFDSSPSFADEKTPEDNESDTDDRRPASVDELRVSLSNLFDALRSGSLFGNGGIFPGDVFITPRQDVPEEEATDESPEDSTNDATPTATPTATATPTPTPTPSEPTDRTPGIDETRVENLIHQYVNEERTQRGLSPLDFDETLRGIARSHSKDMAQRDYFSHTDPEGNDFSDRYQKFG